MKFSHNISIDKDMDSYNECSIEREEHDRFMINERHIKLKFSRFILQIYDNTSYPLLTI